MPEKMPERIWMWSNGKWSREKTTENDVEYLKSTPLLERAGEMRDMLRDLYSNMTVDDNGDWQIPGEWDDTPLCNILSQIKRETAVEGGETDVKT